MPGPIDRRGFARQALLSGVAVVAAAPAPAWVAAAEAGLAETVAQGKRLAIIWEPRGDPYCRNFPLAIVY